MRKIIFAGLALLVSWQLAGQDRGGVSVIDDISSVISSYEAYEVDFKATMKGEFEDVGGKFIVSGKKYYFNAYGSQVFFDGKTRYTYSPADNEVVMETPTSGDTSPLSDPTQILRINSASYSSLLKGESAGLTTVVLTPKSANGVFDTLTVRIDTRTKLPVSFTYALTGISKNLVFNILSITPRSGLPSSTFTFDRAKYKGVEIVDFR